MKTMLLILVTAGVTFASAYLIVSTQQATRAKTQIAAAQAGWEKEKAELESRLADIKSRPFLKSETTPTVVSRSQYARLSPQQIIEKLAAIHPGTTTERPRNLRLVVFFLQSLVEWNTEALSDVKSFLARNEDVDYTIVEETANEAAVLVDQTASQDNRGNRRGNNQAAGGEQNQNNQFNRGNRGGDIFQLRRGGEIRTDFILPPSLRLGLVDVLKAIGGEEAEKILASTLETTGRGIEVAYITRILEQIAPCKYRESAVSVAKDLLTNPPMIDGNSRLDENSKGYLYGVLAMFNDTSFAANAQGLLIGPDGRLDRNAMNYLNSVLMEQAVPSLYAAYQNPNLTNQWEKATIARDILNYAGNNQTANKLLSDIINNADLDARIRFIAILQLAGGGFGPGNSESPTDPAVIAARKRLALSLLASTKDTAITRALNTTIANLDHLAAGEPIENMGFGGGRGNRNRNVGGGGGSAGN